MKKDYSYLLEIQYLGFRYHGWAIQPNAKTVQGMVNKTINYVLGGKKFKILATGRTDAMVSAEQLFVEVFVKEPMDTGEFLTLLNQNLPQDIKAISISEVETAFNIIQSVKSKEYHYYFCFGSKFHPMAAPFMTNILDKLDVNLMISAAKQFEGEHNFLSFCYQPGPEVDTIRTIESCEIVRNTELTASFFPENSYVLKVKGSGFMRQQIRLMMGALIRIGTTEITELQLKSTLEGKEFLEQYIAPASGLVLVDTLFN